MVGVLFGVEIGHLHFNVTRRAVKIIQIFEIYFSTSTLVSINQ